MKKDIHPTYYPETKVTCACGNTFTVGSTRETLEVEICAACHPFYTGQDKKFDNVGQVQKFRERMSKKSETPQKKTPRAKAKKPANPSPSKKGKKA